jgi:hypothetical protein
MRRRTVGNLLRRWLEVALHDRPCLFLHFLSQRFRRQYFRVPAEAQGPLANFDRAAELKLGEQAAVGLRLEALAVVPLGFTHIAGRPTQDSLPAVGQTLPDGLSTRRIPMKGFRFVSYISSSFPKLLVAITSTDVAFAN